MRKKGVAKGVLDRLRAPSASVAVDLLVIVSLLLNFWGLYQSMNMDRELSRIDAQLSTMNRSLADTTANLEGHIRASGSTPEADPDHTSPNSQAPTQARNS
jgi:hypothetical protein